MEQYDRREALLRTRTTTSERIIPTAPFVCVESVLPLVKSWIPARLAIRSIVGDHPS